MLVKSEVLQLLLKKQLTDLIASVSEAVRAMTAPGFCCCRCWCWGGGGFRGDAKKNY